MSDYRWWVGALCVLNAMACASPVVVACDVERGEQVFQKCAVCHPVDPDGAHAAGPNLYGVLGRAVGEVEGFRFSRAMRNAEARWTPTLLDAFLQDPQLVYERTRMAFGGLRNAADRDAVLCYLTRVTTPVADKSIP